MSRRLRARFGLGLLSVAGTAAGHYLSYWIAAPDSHHREELLAATGHAGESPFVIVGIAALLATCIAVLAGQPGHGRLGLMQSFLRLSLLQTIAFVGLEAFERMAAEVHLAEAVAEPVVWLGLGAQLLVALAGAALMRTLLVAASVGSVAPPLVRPVALGVVPAAISLLFSWDGNRLWEARGPPPSS